MSGKTRAAVLEQSGGHTAPYARSTPMRFTELDLDPPGAGEVLVRIEAAGLCHSDLSVVNGDRVRPMPMALGHEGTGIVEALGDGVTGLAPGDRVVLVFLPSCGQCKACLSGEGYLCDVGAAANGKGELLGGGFRLHECGHDVHHHLGVSAFSNRVVVDQRSTVKVDRDIPPQIAAVFGCAVLTGVGAVTNSAKVAPGESVIVFGLGGVGLSALMGAIGSGAATVIGVDLAAGKLDKARELGAIAVSPEGLADAIAEHLPAGGADVVIETVGNAKVLGQAYRAGRRGSRIVTVGLPPPDQNLDIPALSLVAEGKTLIGSYMGSSIPARDIPRYIGMWRAGHLPVEQLISSTHVLEDLNDMLDAMSNGEAIRQIIVF
ncbi:alcohol dehydrogenase [Novosphingobium sp. PC22D]|uniref:alcohol dehydrogenase catalytic domain-containing protein n=1 Tax=Novosphingobium sp. PC22D TaxID=1962403 RepID=UPI000BEFB117|nr:alcohol dehydrogenase catalytic domain-containing protein [Novosphingobium sp. PC22D]PEQ11425.1 alcohol dehydrogenase [Novosphingobium sp. PC22D]